MGDEHLHVLTEEELRRLDDGEEVIVQQGYDGPIKVVAPCELRGGHDWQRYRVGEINGEYQTVERFCDGCNKKQEIEVELGEMFEEKY